jgi:flagellar biosynthesis/type III secretory pathway chaperone
LAVSVCDDYLLKILNKSSIEKTIEIEKDTDNDTKEKSFEFEDLDDEYLLNYDTRLINYCSFLTSLNFQNSSFQYLQIALPQSMNEILIPPPRA